MIHLVMLVFLLWFLLRLVTAPFRWSGRRRFYGGYSNYRYGYGCRRGYGFGGGLVPLIGLLALGRLFGRRW